MSVFPYNEDIEIPEGTILDEFDEIEREDS
jgi:hypothetical protein